MLWIMAMTSNIKLSGLGSSTVSVNIPVWHTLLKWMSMLVTHDNQDQENSDEYKYRTVLQSNKYRYERLRLETWGPLHQSPSQHNTANIITQDIGTTSGQ